MGSEQSNQAGVVAQSQSSGRKTHPLRRGKSVPEQKHSDIPSRPGSCSPGLSVCSDTDVPYIPYTVNRPIGDSPKLSKYSKSQSIGGAILQSKRLTLKKQNKTVVSASQQSTGHNIVVVKEASVVDTDSDVEIQRLLNIPSFVPIMRGTVLHPSQRDPEVLERLDPCALYRLCLRFQSHLNDCAVATSEDQLFLSKQMKQTEMRVTQLKNDFNERLKSFSKNTNQLSKVNELSSQITRCHLLLNTALESVERLNNLLPPDDRLEPFVWTTG